MSYGRLKNNAPIWCKQHRRKAVSGKALCHLNQFSLFFSNTTAYWLIKIYYKAGIPTSDPRAADCRLQDKGRNLSLAQKPHQSQGCRRRKDLRWEGDSTGSGKGMGIWEAPRAILSGTLQEVRPPLRYSLFSQCDNNRKVISGTHLEWFPMTIDRESKG